MEMADDVKMGSFPHTPHSPTGELEYQQASEAILWEGGSCGMKPISSNSWALIIPQQSYFISLAKQSLESQGVGTERT